MTASNFAKLLKPLVGIEGGVSDRPLKADPGGLTNKGVTQATYDLYRKSRGLALRSVRALTQAEMTEIYKVQFWDAVKGDSLPGGLDWAVFDFAVNSGASRAVKELQRVLGVKLDGIVGLDTLGAVDRADTAKTINHYCDRRLVFMRGLKNWGANKNGWRRRVSEVRAAALDMADDSTPEPEKIVLTSMPATAAAKAPETAQAQLKTPEGVGLTCSAAAAGGEKVRQVAEGLHAHVGMDTVLGRLAFAAFTLLMLIGGGLVAYSYVGRIREKGGLGGYIGSVFKGATP